MKINFNYPIILLTCKETERYNKFIEINKNLKYEIFWGDFSIESTQKIIFDNYLNILDLYLEKENNELIIVIEDDVKLLSGWENVLDKALNEVPDDWDTISGNFSFVEEIEKISENVIKPIGVRSSMNFTCFHKRCLKKIKNNLNLRKFPEYKHFDRYCFSEKVNLNSFGTYPMICKEIGGYSFNNKKIMNTFYYLKIKDPKKYHFL